MRIVMMTDLEGVSGVVSFTDQAYPDGKYYEQAKQLLTAEVNAAIEAMLEDAVDDVVVVDGHGAGGIVFEALHPAAKLMHGRPCAEWEVQEEIFRKYDASVMIGQHSMAGTARGNLNHTQSSRTVEYYKLNDRFIGEIAQWSLYCGALGLPMIFLSGDEAACKEAGELIPEVTTAIVKIGLSRTHAMSLSQDEAHRRIREGVRLAVKKQLKTPVKPLIWQGPFTLEKRFLFTETADAFQSNPLYERVDAKTVRLCSDNILDIIYA